MTRWVRFRANDAVGFGVLDQDTISVASGDMFNQPQLTGERVALDSVELLTPCEPSKIIGLWRNFYALESVVDMPTPKQPLYFLKATSSLCSPNQTIQAPRGYDGTVIFEGELAIVVGRRASCVSEAEAKDYIFGYTCINDVTALDAMQADEHFAHWSRAKGFDTFCPLGPAISTTLDVENSRIEVIVDGNLRQDYPFNDMILTPAKLVSQLSFDMTLMPGDVIAAGTSIGVGRLKPGKQVTVRIEGIGELTNTYAN